MLFVLKYPNAFLSFLHRRSTAGIPLARLRAHHQRPSFFSSLAERAGRGSMIVSPRAVKQTFSLSLSDDCVVYAAHDVTLRETGCCWNRSVVIATTRRVILCQQQPHTVLYYQLGTTVSTTAQRRPPAAIHCCLSTASACLICQSFGCRIPAVTLIFSRFSSGLLEWPL